MTTTRQSDREKLAQYFDNQSDIDLLLSIKYDLSPEQFEDRVADYYHRIEGYQTTVQGGFDDEGVDIVAHKAGSPTLYIQCKKWIQGHITMKDIGYFYGIVTDQTDENIQMVYVTTTWITPNAKKFAKSKNIVLKNYRDIVDMARSMGDIDQWLSQHTGTAVDRDTTVDRDTDDTDIPTTSLVDREGPQIAKLQAEITSLSDLIAKEKINFSALQQALYLFKLEYQAIIAPYYLQKLAIDTQIMKKRKTLQQAEKILGESDYEPIDIDDTQLNQEKEYYAGQQAEQYIRQQKESKLDEHEKDTLKKLRKKLMGKYHPDRHMGDDELYKKATHISQEINEAYRNFDLAKLLEIEKKYANGIAQNHGIISSYSIEELMIHKNKLESQILDIQDEYKILQNTELYIMYKEYLVYQKNGKNFFQKLIDEIQEEIAIAQSVLSSLNNT